MNLPGWLRKLFICVMGMAGGVSAQAPPAFTWDERLQSYLHGTHSWQRLTVAGAGAGLDHLRREPRCWDRGANSFARRYGAGMARRAVHDTIELGAGALLNEDTRFRPSGAASFRARLRHAALETFRTSGDNPRLAYARLLGTAGAVLLAPAIYPAPMSVPHFFQGAGWGYLGRMGSSFLTEFSGDLKKMGPRGNLWVSRSVG